MPNVRAGRPLRPLRLVPDRERRTGRRHLPGHRGAARPHRRGRPLHAVPRQLPGPPGGAHRGGGLAGRVRAGRPRLHRGELDEADRAARATAVPDDVRELLGFLLGQLDFCRRASDRLDTAPRTRCTLAGRRVGHVCTEDCPLDKNENFVRKRRTACRPAPRRRCCTSPRRWPSSAAGTPSPPPTCRAVLPWVLSRPAADQIHSRRSFKSPRSGLPHDRVSWILQLFDRAVAQHAAYAPAARRRRSCGGRAPARWRPWTPWTASAHGTDRGPLEEVLRGNELNGVVPAISSFERPVRALPERGDRRGRALIAPFRFPTGGPVSPKSSTAGELRAKGPRRFALGRRPVRRVVAGRRPCWPTAGGTARRRAGDRRIPAAAQQAVGAACLRRADGAAGGLAFWNAAWWRSCRPAAPRRGRRPAAAARQGLELGEGLSREPAWLDRYVSACSGGLHDLSDIEAFSCAPWSRCWRLRHLRYGKALSPWAVLDCGRCTTSSCGRVRLAAPTCVRPRPPAAGVGRSPLRAGRRK